MKYAIISDIHGNLEALQAVLKDIEDREISSHICLGDIAGYGANPNECVDVIRALNCPCILGNHDAGAVGITNISNFNSAARTAIEYHDEVLNDENKEYLRDLKLTDRIENFTVVHANLEDPKEWGYIFNSYEAEHYFPFQKDTVCFFGHTHIQCSFTSNTQTPYSKASKLKIKPGHKYLINVGSVGQPRDGNPEAAYGIYDLETNTVTLERVPYDIETAQQKILDANLPNILALRLAIGK
jgi:predicted phosphodiesterase